MKVDSVSKKKDAATSLPHISYLVATEVSDIKGRSTYLRVLFSPKKCITTTDRNAGNLQNFGMTGRAFHEISTLSQNFYLQLKVHL